MRLSLRSCLASVAALALLTLASPSLAGINSSSSVVVIAPHVAAVSDNCLQPAASVPAPIGAPMLFVDAASNCDPVILDVAGICLTEVDRVGALPSVPMVSACDPLDERSPPG